jgi:hypothetical protein
MKQQAVSLGMNIKTANKLIKSDRLTVFHYDLENALLNKSSHSTDLIMLIQQQPFSELPVHHQATYHIRS